MTHMQFDYTKGRLVLTVAFHCTRSYSCIQKVTKYIYTKRSHNHKLAQTKASG